MALDSSNFDPVSGWASEGTIFRNIIFSHITVRSFVAGNEGERSEERWRWAEALPQCGAGRPGHPLLPSRRRPLITTRFRTTDYIPHGAMDEAYARL
jgi:hypothetical protein